MPDITFNCPYCDQSIEAPAEMSESVTTCPTCSQEIQVPVSDSGEENCAYTDTTGSIGSISLSQAKCRNCGATVAFEATQKTLKCGFCGTCYAVNSGLDNLPDANFSNALIIPLSIDEKKAQRIFATWLGKGFWAPRNLSSSAKVKSACMSFVPIWVFKASVRTEWNGLYAQTHYRTVTKTRSVYRNGQPSEESYVDNEPYTVYVPQNGTHSGEYLELITGSGALTQRELEMLAVDVSMARSFSNDYIRGWQCTQPSVSEVAVIKTVKEQILERERTACSVRTTWLKDWSCRFISQRSFSVYVPVWMVPFTYGGKNYRMLINGQSGKTYGSRPISLWKMLFAIIILGIMLTYLIYAEKI